MSFSTDGINKNIPDNQIPSAMTKLSLSQNDEIILDSFANVESEIQIGI